MVPEGSLPHSQVPATSPYPEPARFSPYPTSTSWRSILILSSHLPWISQAVSFPQVTPSNPCIHVYFFPYVLHVPPISFFSIWSPEQYRVRTTYHNLSLCSFLRSPLTSSLLGPNILLSTLFSNTLTLRSSCSVSDQVSHTYKTTGKIIDLYILMFIFLEDKIFCTEW